MKDTHEKFSLPTVLLHWLIAIPFIGMIVVGLILEDMERGPDKGALIGVHKSVGILILVFAVLRILWRIKNNFPKPLSEMPSWQKGLASLAHWVLIIGTVMMPVSGIIMSIGGGHPIGIFGLEIISGSEVQNESLSEIGHILHGLGGKLMILFVVLHIIGAVKHQRVDKDGTLSRMLGKTVAREA